MPAFSILVVLFFFSFQSKLFCPSSGILKCELKEDKGLYLLTVFCGTFCDAWPSMLPFPEPPYWRYILVHSLKFGEGIFKNLSNSLFRVFEILRLGIMLFNDNCHGFSTSAFKTSYFWIWSQDTWCRSQEIKYRQPGVKFIFEKFCNFWR